MTRKQALVDALKRWCIGAGILLLFSSALAVTLLIILIPFLLLEKYAEIPILGIFAVGFTAWLFLSPIYDMYKANLNKQSEE